MKPLTKYAIILALCKTWDLYTTWLRTPDLSRELNVVVRLFGSNWTLNILYNIVVWIATLLIVRIVISTDKSLWPQHQNATKYQLLSFLYCGEIKSPWKLLFATPSSFSRFWYILAGVLLFAEPLIHIVAGTSNLMLTLSSSYDQWFNTNLTYKVAIELIIIVGVSLYAFLYREFKIYKAKAA
ncbi:MAG: hypothetical protein ABSD46_01705 [Bacteroidota bacterium]